MLREDAWSPRVLLNTRPLERTLGSTDRKRPARGSFGAASAEVEVSQAGPSRASRLGGGEAT